MKRVGTWRDVEGRYAWWIWLTFPQGSLDCFLMTGAVLDHELLLVVSKPGEAQLNPIKYSQTSNSQGLALLIDFSKES